MKEKKLLNQLANHFKNNYYLSISDFTKIIPEEYLTDFLISMADQWKSSSKLNREFFLYIKNKTVLTDEIVSEFLEKSVDFIGDLLDSNFYRIPTPTLIKHYAKFKQMLPGDYYEKALRSNDPVIFASLIEYNPSLQYTLPVDRIDLCKIESSVLNAMYWWEKLKGTYQQELLFLDPDKWMASFKYHTAYYKKEMIKKRWDVPFKLFIKKPKTLLRKYARELLQNPFTPAAVVLLIKAEYPKTMVSAPIQGPLNQRLEMLKKWEENSLQEFYEKVYKKYNSL